MSIAKRPENISMKYLRLLLIVVLSISTVGVAKPAAAAEKCLAQFPDSAWSKGQPGEVFALLNSDLILTKIQVIHVADQTNLLRGRAIPELYDLATRALSNTWTQFTSANNYTETTYPLLVTFEYQGVSCLTRQISVQGGSITYKPSRQIEFGDSAGIKKILDKGNWDKDFRVTQLRIDKLKEFSEFLESTKDNPLKITSRKNNKRESFGSYLGIDKYIQEAFGNYGIWVLSEDGCLSNSFSEYEKARTDALNSKTVLEKTLDQSFSYLLGTFDSLNFAGEQKLCKLKVLHFLNSRWRDPEYPTTMFGYVWVENKLPVSGKNSTQAPTITQKKIKNITCVKGKRSKNVSGTRPKCPSGYKLKK